MEEGGVGNGLAWRPRLGERRWRWRGEGGEEEDGFGQFATLQDPSKPNAADENAQNDYKAGKGGKSGLWD